MWLAYPEPEAPEPSFSFSFFFFLLHHHKLQTTLFAFHGLVTNLAIFPLQLRLRVKACLKYPILNLGTPSAAFTFLELDKTC